MAQALEMIIHWVRRDGMEAIEQAQSVLDTSRGVDKRLFNQLLELMEEKYYGDTLHSPHINGPRLDSSLALRQIFNTMRNEIPKLLCQFHDQGLGFGSESLRDPTLEANFSTTLDKILRLSSWTPSNTHNKHLRKLLRDALLMINDLGGKEEYHDYLRDFMKQHTAFCAFTLGNADLIMTGDSKKTAELCKNLRRLAQNLGKIASTKAEQYQKLYENFIAHKEELSRWLDTASPGQGKLCICFYASPFEYLILVGRLLVDGFTDSLKDMASNMRREAGFWKQSNQFHRWPNIRQTYGCAIDAMPSEPHNDHRGSTTPSVHGSVTQVNCYPELLIVINAYQ